MEITTYICCCGEHRTVTSKLPPSKVNNNLVGLGTWSKTRLNPNAPIFVPLTQSSPRILNLLRKVVSHWQYVVFYSKKRSQNVILKWKILVAMKRSRNVTIRRKVLSHWQSLVFHSKKRVQKVIRKWRTLVIWRKKNREHKLILLRKHFKVWKNINDWNKRKHRKKQRKSNRKSNKIKKQKLACVAKLQTRWLRLAFDQLRRKPDVRKYGIRWLRRVRNKSSFRKLRMTILVMSIERRALAFLFMVAKLIVNKPYFTKLGVLMLSDCSADVHLRLCDAVCEKMRTFPVEVIYFILF